MWERVHATILSTWPDEPSDAHVGIGISPRHWLPAVSFMLSAEMDPCNSTSLGQFPHADSGDPWASGEPTLFCRMGELVEAVKETTDVPLAVLTNGALLWDGEVRARRFSCCANVNGNLVVGGSTDRGSCARCVA